MICIQCIFAVDYAAENEGSEDDETPGDVEGECDPFIPYHIQSIHDTHARSL